MPRLKPYSRSAVRCSGVLVPSRPPISAQPANRKAVLRRMISKCSSSVIAGVASLGELVELALDHLQRAVAEQAHDLERVLRERHRHRPDVEVVAEQHRDVATPSRVRAQAAPPGLGPVDDVVVHERGGVDELDDRSVQHTPVTGIAAQARGQEQDGRPYALAPAHLDVLAHLRDQLDARLEVAGELVLHPRQLVTNRLEDLREVRDGGGRGIHSEELSNENIGFSGVSTRRPGARFTLPRQ